MTNKTKTVAGISAIGTIALVFHLLHIVHTATSMGQENNSGFKNAKAVIVFKDSLNGNLDTMDLAEYNKRHK